MHSTNNQFDLSKNKLFSPINRLFSFFASLLENWSIPIGTVYSQFGSVFGGVSHAILYIRRVHLSISSPCKVPDEIMNYIYSAALKL